jgi:hypothetical protein
MERIMEFKITEAEAREMAKFEEEVGCDPSAGADWGIHLDKVISTYAKIFMYFDV